MKKIVSLFLSILLALTLAACGAQEPAFTPSISSAPVITAGPRETPSQAPGASSSPSPAYAPQPTASRSAPAYSSVPEEQQEASRTQTVYWTPSGKVYHTTPDCSALAKSKTILEGTAGESGKPRVCKLCG